MADISKCTGVGCKQKEFCYRYSAITSSHRQSWFAKVPMDAEGNCDELWEMKCRYCGQFNGIHKLSCTTGKITVKL